MSRLYFQVNPILNIKRQETVRPLCEWTLWTVILSATIKNWTIVADGG